jgi:enoyl-CoA hydratase/carnithine racemase
LPRLVGISKAKEMMYTNRRISGEEAFRIGLVDYVVPKTELDATAKKLANEIIAKSASAVAAAKATVYKAITLPLDEGLEFERKSFGALFGTRDQKEAMAAFLEKRKATYKDSIDEYLNNYAIYNQI